MEDRDILKLVVGSPNLVGFGYLPLEDAGKASGVAVPELLRQVQSGALRLYYTISHRHGTGYSISKYQLDPIEPEAGVDAGFVSPYSPGVTLPSTATRINVSGATLRLVDGHLFAKAIEHGENSIEQFTLQAPSPSKPDEWFFPDMEIGSVPVRELLLSKQEVEKLRAGLASTVTVERIEKARETIASEWTAATAGKPPGKGGKWAKKRFSSGVDAYCLDPHGLGHKLSDTSEIGLRKRGLCLFGEFMGDLTFERIDRDVLRKFIYEVLPTLPNKSNNLPGEITTIVEASGRSRKATMTEIVASLNARSWVVNGEAWPKMTAGARDERRQWLCGLFKWAHESGYIEVDPAASFNGKRVATKPRKGTSDDEITTRILFTPEQLKTIFSQERFAKGGVESTHKNGAIYPFEYWLPLLSLYGGLRVEEASQLHLDDIGHNADGGWYLNINRKGEKSLKNDNAVREVPIHPELLRLGLIDYRDRLEVEGFRRLFPELTYKKASGYGGTASNKFSKLFESFGWPRDGTLVFHCFRHNANDGLWKVDSSVLGGSGDNFKRYVQCKIMGHETGSDANTAHYTHATLAQRAALIHSMTFDLQEIQPFNVAFGVDQVKSALKRKKEDGKGKESVGLKQWRSPSPAREVGLF